MPHPHFYPKYALKTRSVHRKGLARALLFLLLAAFSSADAHRLYDGPGGTPPRYSMAISNADLPNIGGPASTELSPTKEIELGRVLLTEVRRRLPVSSDPELAQYVQALGTRITSGGTDSNFPFTFLLVKDPAINAFALPGGVIAINSGLFTLAARESELASVFAHEIAHVTQRHIARNFENAKAFNVVSALTFLGALLASVYNVDLGQAALMTSQAGVQQAKFSYSRNFEEEADRIGMQLMIGANIDPYGMPLFFKRMHKYTQLNRGKLPEFLSTHPPTLKRASESEARARQYRGTYAINSTDFEYARARTLALSENPTALIDHYREKNRATAGLSDTEYYTYALALSRAGKHAQGLRYLEKITIDTDNRLRIQLADAQLRLAMGQTSAARATLESLDHVYPGNLPVTYYLATSLIKEDLAHEALEKLDQISDDDTRFPAINKIKARAASRAGMPWRSHESLGNFYAAHGQYSLAMEQIELALQVPDIDTSSKARIEALGIRLLLLKQEREQFQ